MLLRCDSCRRTVVTKNPALEDEGCYRCKAGRLRKELPKLKLPPPDPDGVVRLGHGSGYADPNPPGRRASFSVSYTSSRRRRYS